MKYSIADVQTGLLSGYLIKQVSDDTKDDGCLFDSFEEAKANLLNRLNRSRDDIAEAIDMLEATESAENL